MHGDEIMAIVGMGCLFGTLTITVIAVNVRRLIELRMRGGNVDLNVTKELQELKQQMAEMRDTSTRYDVSFDAALQRIESRVGNVEQRVGTLESQKDTVSLHGR